MQLLAKYVVNIVGVLLLSACATSGPPLADSNDQLPMYGGSDRQADPGLRAADDRLTAELLQRYGNPQAAARNLLDQGVRYFKAGDYAMAMKSFNQAWLMDPNGPEPFWGFAVVYDDQGKSCMAKAMVDRALSLNLSKPAELADAGRIYTYCAVSDAGLFEMPDSGIMLEAEVVTQEIRWRMREVARDLCLRGANLEQFEAEMLQPLISLLDAGGS